MHTASDSSGFIYDKDGINAEKLVWLTELKEVRRGRISEYAEHFGCEFHEGKRPWNVPADLALPCATQNEITLTDAQAMINNNVQAIVEGANMPTTADAVIALQKAGILFGPAKAANAGGVAVSGLEQSQNALRITWSHEEVDQRLQVIMKDIHQKCVQHSAGSNEVVDYVKGANISGFIKVADAMVAYGAI